MSTYKILDEVTDVAVDGVRGVWYFSRDVGNGGARIFVVRLGPDRRSTGRADDRRRSFPTSGFGAYVREGTAWGKAVSGSAMGTGGMVLPHRAGAERHDRGDADDDITSRDLQISSEPRKPRGCRVRAERQPVRAPEQEER